MRAWCRLMKNNKIIRSDIVELSASKLSEFVEEACQLYDLSRPIVLKKHNDEWANFAHTSFVQEHFIDSFGYDRLELEIVKEKRKES